MSETLLFDTLTQAVPGLVWVGDQQGHIRFVNARWSEYTGLSQDQIRAQGWLEAIHPADVAGFVARLGILPADGDTLHSEIRIRRHDGVYHRHMISARDAGGGTWLGCAIDAHDWLATELRDATQGTILKLVIAGVALPHLLDELCRAAERQIPGAACSILLVDATEGTFAGGSAPNLPAEIISALTGVRIGQGVGSCGTAAFAKRDVISMDIANDPLWTDWRHLALPLGFRACWSQPVLSSQDEVIATFGFYFRDSRAPSSAEAQDLARIRGLATLAIERARMLAALRESEEHYRHTVELNPQIPWTADAQGRIISFSSRWTQVTGISEAEGLGDGWRLALHPDDEERASRIWTTALRTGQPLDTTYRFRMQSGRYKWIRARATARLDDQGKIIRWYGTLEDVHEAYLANEKLKRQAYQDDLTGLPNRRKFTEVLKHSLLSTQSHVGLMVLDLDDFKLVNDLYGHLTGDAVLRLFARYLQKMTAQDEFFARLGGDEFAIICPNIRHEDDLLARARKIEGLLDAQLKKNLKTRSCRPSIGCAIGAATDNPEDLFNRADLALYAAKDAGKGIVKLFDPCIRSAATRRRDAFDLARLALREQWIEPFYQPIVDFKSQRIRGFEALLRIRHPQDGILLPAMIKEALDDPRLADGIGIRMIQQIIADMAPDAAGGRCRGRSRSIWRRKTW